ncbi:hypothetical protein GCM10011351_07750 [Paraliobacillus quinghaiensis]|uniref:STAS/SEC14 domain-containing protein n=1 Tax=Paraliobacillus quinghaiensis TaxID=470815 RepID=A0A917WS53_9BACI|nr:STAS/SEC14 domain-containing protein [Paraliobacillus quinghaiensis]GGM24427.1 hypothetical protein GCM10011351_07750 [Paraliobacillus quinghaiensis]
MIKFKTNNIENVIEIEVEGAIMEQDIKDFEHYFEEKKAEQGKINLLMVLNGVRYSTKGLIEDFKFDKNHWDDFNKIAVVSDKKWIEFGTKVMEIFPKVEVEHFNKDEREKALAWLQ